MVRRDSLRLGFLTWSAEFVVAVQGHFQSLDNREALADADHLLQGRFDLALQQIDFLRGNPLQLGLELVVETSDAVNLAQ